MKVSKLVRGIIVTVIGLLFIGVGFEIYIYYTPPKDIKGDEAEYYLSVNDIVSEYLNDAELANTKYLSEDGYSKIMEISGIVMSKSVNFNGQYVVVLIDNGNDKAGVSCTFASDAGHCAEGLKMGEQIRIKGVIRSGATYDSDFDIYENVVLEKCSVVGCSY
jgi:hypothetical protein